MFSFIPTSKSRGTCDSERYQRRLTKAIANVHRWSRSATKAKLSEQSELSITAVQAFWLVTRLIGIVCN